MRRDRDDDEDYRERDLQQRQRILNDKLLRGLSRKGTYKIADRMLEPGMRDEEGREGKIQGKRWEKEI